MLDLENAKENINQLVDRYNLCVANNHFLLDSDLEELFYNSNIKVGRTLYKEKDWKCDIEDGCLVGCEDGDYLETIELIQDGKIYLCKAFSDECGCGLDYTLELMNVLKMVKYVSGSLTYGHTVTLEVDGKQIKRRIYYTRYDGLYVVINNERYRVADIIR